MSKECPVCGAAFERAKAAKYCSDKCQKRGENKRRYKRIREMLAKLRELEARSTASAV